MLQIRKILFAGTPSVIERHAFGHAFFIAGRLDASLIVLQHEAPGRPEPDLLTEAIRQAEEVSYRHRTRGGPLHKVHVQLEASREKDRGSDILDAATAHVVDLIVMPTTPPGQAVTASGDARTIAEVVRRAPCPVMVMNHPSVSESSVLDLPSIQHVLVPVDFSRDSPLATRYGKALASLYGAQVTLLHVVDSKTVPTVYGLGLDPTMASVTSVEALAWYALRLLEDAAGGVSVPVAFEVGKGDPVAYIRSYSQGTNGRLIVISAQGLSSSRAGALGRTAHAVLQEVQCPVLTIKNFQRVVFGETVFEKEKKAAPEGARQHG